MKTAAEAATVTLVTTGASLILWK